MTGAASVRRGKVQDAGCDQEDFLHVVHGFAPVFDERSRVLILGTFPSTASRAAGFYYGHPRNRFWRVLSCVLMCDVPCTTEEKKRLLLANHIALWDVVSSCDIRRSEDASIKNAIANDLRAVLNGAPVGKVLLNGGKAFTLYAKLCRPLYPLPCQRLPSTSGANASCSFAMLCRVWSEALEGFGGVG